MRNLKLAPNISSNIPPIIDITDQLPKKASWESLKKKYIVKGQWDGKTYHQGKFRDPKDIDTIVIHHSGPPNGTLQSHARFHADKWGAGIAYHICIDQDQIKQVNDLRSFTYHAGNNNTYTVGIEVNRDLSKVDLTPRERELLYAAILSVKAVLPIKHIVGHREVSPTACPVTSMDRIRADILSMEEEMSFNQDTAALAADAYKLATRVKDLQGKLKHPTWGKESARKLGLLKPVVDGTAEVIASTILSLYKTVNDEGFVGENADKLAGIVAEAKKEKLI
ncbi:peptidoglycan recognition family protein [Cohnella sp. GCM10027633]|uniref:peptidoglycan recognition protein family protein n=1 Tax=unclassified Cohnella TaxID=2636738 RepID=UPI003639B373